MVSEKVLDLLKSKTNIIEESDHEILWLVGPVNLPVQLDDETVTFQWYTWLKTEKSAADTASLLSYITESNLADARQSSVLVYGDFESADNAFVRFHSICHTGDIFGSKRCDCGFQLHESMRMIVKQGHGALFYLANHEGRGIGLFPKALAYLLQQEGYDTVEANLELGFDDDMRTYEDAMIVLQALREKPIKLITNNPRKLSAFRERGLKIEERIPLWGDVSRYNEKYLQTKINKAGHILSEPEQEKLIG
jgi:GTP cyclohydrolase II